MAEFCAVVGVPMTIDQITLQKPRVFSIHSDHEGGYISNYFTEFRAKHSLHHTMSPPHDHDLNPIAERIIGNISAKARTFKLSSNATIGFWPYMIANAVNWHNETNGATGSSTASEQLSPHQNFTLTQPNGMDLPSFGCRTVAVVPPAHKIKTNLSPRGYMCIMLGRSQTSIGAYNLWCPSLGKVICSSNVLCDEENFPWFGDEAHKPLTATAHITNNQLPKASFVKEPALADEGVTNGDTVADLNLPPNRSPLKFLSLFSGKYHRAGGLPKHLKDLGWDEVTQVDSSPAGGGWDHDLFNDQKFTQLKIDITAGMYDVMFIAFPCTTFSMSRFFQEPGKEGPPVIHCKDHPDGRPLDQIPGKHHRELRLTSKLLDRVTELATCARRSPKHTTIIWESPAKRSVKGTVQYCSDMPLHSTVFDTKQFAEMVANTSSVSPWSSCTFAWCRMGSDAQKYCTLWYTNDAALALDKLNGAAFQCNHPEGTHPRQAGVRLPDGSWASEDFVAFPQLLNAHIAIGATVARTGVSELSSRVTRSKSPIESSPISGDPRSTDHPVAEPVEAPNVSAPTSSPPPIALSPEAIGSPTHAPQAPTVDPFEPQGRVARSVRSSTLGARSEANDQAQRVKALERQLQREETRAAKEFGASLPRISEMPTPPHMRSVDAGAMEELVSNIVSRVHNKAGGRRSPTKPVGEWIDVPASRVGHSHPNYLPSKLRDLPQGTFVLELSSNEVKAVFGDTLSGDPTNTPHAHVSLLSTLQAVDDTPFNHKCRAYGR